MRTRKTKSASSPITRYFKRKPLAALNTLTRKPEVAAQRPQRTVPATPAHADIALPPTGTENNHKSGLGTIVLKQESAVPSNPAIVIASPLALPLLGTGGVKPGDEVTIDINGSPPPSASLVDLTIPVPKRMCIDLTVVVTPREPSGQPPGRSQPAQLAISDGLELLSEGNLPPDSQAKSLLCKDSQTMEPVLNSGATFDAESGSVITQSYNRPKLHSSKQLASANLLSPTVLCEKVQILNVSSPLPGSTALTATKTSPPSSPLETQDLCTDTSMGEKGSDSVLSVEDTLEVLLWERGVPYVRVRSP